MDVEFLEFVASEKAKNICKEAISDEVKRAKCVEILTKAAVYGDSVMKEVREEMGKMFTEGERKLIANEIKKHMYRLFQIV